MFQNNLKKFDHRVKTKKSQGHKTKQKLKKDRNRFMFKFIELKKCALSNFI